MDLKEKLTALYAQGAKHDNYQNLPEFVKKELNFNFTINEDWRGDSARYRYILNEINGGEVIGDVGANTGFFTLSLAKEFPDSNFFAYEMNDRHVEFINEISEYFNLTNITALSVSVNYNGLELIKNHDILLHLNVLHHAGVDFDKEFLKNELDFSNYAEKYFTKLLNKTKILFFQMGYNWGGNKQKPIVPLNADMEKILFILRLFAKTGWKPKKIALCQNKDNSLEYNNIDEIVSETMFRQCKQNESISGDIISYFQEYRFENLSEFYRRPFFIAEHE